MNQLPSTINTLAQIEKFQAKDIWLSEKPNNLLENLVERITFIWAEIEKIGNEASLHLEQGTAEKEDYFLAYVWVEQAKSYLLLWRDILFEQHKARILQMDLDTSDVVLRELEKQSEEVLQKAYQEFRTFTEKGAQSVSLKQIEQWKHQTNSWSVYHAQMQEIEQQSHKLLAQHGTLSESVGYFQTIQNIIINLLEDCEEEVGKIKEVAKETAIYIQENLDQSSETKFSKLSNYLEELEKKYHINHHLKAFLDRWENEKLSLPHKHQYVVDINEGILLYKEISFNKVVRQWTDSEILPVLYEVWELLERIENQFKVSLSNMRNRIILLSKEDQVQEVNSDTMISPLNSFLEKTKDHEGLLLHLSSTVEKRLQEEFRPSAIFDHLTPFLNVPFQNTVNQFRLNQSSFLNKATQWWNNQTGRLRQVTKSVQEGEVLSLSERIARLIQSRREASNYLQYASIFQTEGYIGESFCVGRTEELERIRILIKQWREGFRGTVLLTGQRFAGKTLLGELIINKHFSSNAIVLSPQSNIEVQGRKMTTTYDLGQALDFIQKYSLQEYPLVWIDDLEYWWDTQITLGKNVRQLFYYLDRYATRIFFVVSMSNWLKAHLSKYYEINKLFQATINLDRMSAQQVQNAILTRHGATHKTLVNKKGIEINPAQFQRLSNKIYRIAEGNIGEALLRWSYAIKEIEDSDQVEFTNNISNYLPDFLNPDTAILLSTIMMEKKTNEYRLRKLFGAPFGDKYNGLLQRLLHVGLLTRDLSGWLEVNELVVNDVGKLLDRKNYISFYQL